MYVLAEVHTFVYAHVSCRVYFMHTNALASAFALFAQMGRKGGKDGEADLWLKEPVRTDVYVVHPVQKGKRKSLVRRMSSWMWR